MLPGGCTGFSHKLDLDVEVSPQVDLLCESEGLQLVFWKSQLEMLRGARVDHGEKNGQTGFIVHNPNVDSIAGQKWLPKLADSVPEKERPKQLPLSDRIAEYRRLSAEDPKNELGHFRLGQLLQEAGQPADAAKSFERAVELSPDFTKAYQLLGECYLALNQRDRAVAILTKGVAIAERQGDAANRDAIAKLLNSARAPVQEK